MSENYRRYQRVPAHKYCRPGVRKKFLKIRRGVKPGQRAYLDKNKNSTTYLNSIWDKLTLEDGSPDRCALARARSVFASTDVSVKFHSPSGITDFQQMRQQQKLFELPF